MAAGTPLASIGVKIGYASGTKSDSDTVVAGKTFTRVYDIKSTPDFNPSPNTADATTFDNLNYTTYVDLLKDLGGSLEFTANLTAEFISAWNGVSNSVVSTAGSTGCWFCIDIPGVTNSVCFFGMPSAMGLPSLTANSLMETTVYVTPYTEPKWLAATVS